MLRRTSSGLYDRALKRMDKTDNLLDDCHADFQALIKIAIFDRNYFHNL